jgi:predicted dehydrogenase
MPVVPNSAPPEGVNYEMWLGPAPQRPFNSNRFHGSFRYFWDYAGGLMTDWGVHMIDMVLAGMAVTAPKSVTASGGKYGFPDSAAETPDTMYALYDFGDFSMLWEQALGVGNGPYNYDRGQPGVAFMGNLGTLVINRERWEVLPEVESGKFMTEPLPVQKNYSNGLDLHTLNFVECIKSREKTNCTIETGRNAALNAQIGNIAYKLGNKVNWDSKKGAFIDNAQANKLAKASYNTPWKLPKV